VNVPFADCAFERGRNPATISRFWCSHYSRGQDASEDRWRPLHIATTINAFWSCPSAKLCWSESGWEPGRFHSQASYCSQGAEWTKSRLEQTVANSLFSRDKMASIIAENQELCWIIAASIKTARGGARPIW